MRNWLVGKLFQLLLRQPEYSWLKHTATFDNPLGPVNPRSEASYKTALAQVKADADVAMALVAQLRAANEELRGEQRALRRIIDRLDRETALQKEKV